MANIKHLMGLSFMIVIGLLLIVLACVLPKKDNFLPLVCVFFYGLAAFWNLWLGSKESDDEEGGWPFVGMFLTSVWVVSGLAFPAVLAHVGTITTTGLGLSLAGGFIIYGSVAVFVTWFYDKEDEGGFF